MKSFLYAEEDRIASDSRFSFFVDKEGEAYRCYEATGICYDTGVRSDVFVNQQENVYIVFGSMLLLLILVFSFVFYKLCTGELDIL